MMRYGPTRITKERFKALCEGNYRGIMLGFMGLELLLLAFLVVVEVLDYLKR
jgi:hypothetical protein